MRTCPQPLVAQGPGVGPEPRVWGQVSPLRHLQREPCWVPHQQPQPSPREKPALTISGMKSTSGKVVRTARPLGKELVVVEEDIGSLWHGDDRPLCTSLLNAASLPLPLSLSLFLLSSPSCSRFFLLFSPSCSRAFPPCFLLTGEDSYEWHRCGQTL